MNNNMERHVKINTVGGAYSFPLNNLPIFPIQNVLSELQIARIGEIYAAIKYVPTSIPIYDIRTLEHFELDFMRMANVEEEIAKMENVVEAFKKAMGKIEKDNEIDMFFMLLLNAYDGLTKEEKEKENIRQLVNIYEEVRKAREEKGK